MTQPPDAPGGGLPPENDPYRPPHQPPQQNQWVTPGSGQSAGQSEHSRESAGQSEHSGQSAGRPEETQQLPPYGQPSAGQPYGQSSAGQPYAGAYSQPSSGNPYEQARPYDPNQPPTGAPAGPPAGAPAGPPAGPPGAPQQFGSWQPQPPQQRPQRRISDANPLRAAFDFSFTSYATPGLVKIIYILATIVAGLWWIGGGLTTLIAGIAARNLGGGGGTLVLGVFALLLGWIPALLGLLFVRIVLEASLALVRAADDIRHLRTKIED